MEQPRPRPTVPAKDAVPVGRALLAVGLTIAASACAQPKQRGEVITPASRVKAEERPLHITPPVTIAKDDDAIVRILGDVACTGTLIGDDQVLTAHHCVVARDKDGKFLERNKAPHELGIEVGGDYLPWGEVSVRAVIAPECGYRAGHGDIAILVLSRHLIGMPTMKVQLEAPPEVKDPIQIQGFGHCALSNDAIHRVPRAAQPVDRVESSHFEALASVCPGDSGGPVFTGGRRIVGVISASVMDGDDRTEGRSLFTRVDIWPQLFAAAHEISNGASPSELPPYSDCRTPPRTAHKR